jgi:hypothetical protein
MNVGGIVAAALVDRHRPGKLFVLGSEDDREPAGSMGACHFSGQAFDVGVGRLHDLMMPSAASGLGVLSIIALPRFEAVTR